MDLTPTFVVNDRSPPRSQEGCLRHHPGVALLQGLSLKVLDSNLRSHLPGASSLGALDGSVSGRVSIYHPLGLSLIGTQTGRCWYTIKLVVDEQPKNYSDLAI